MNKEFFINNVDDLQKVSGEILNIAKGKNKVALYGEMGAGKTTLVKALCKKLGVSEEVLSPTFSIINEYADQNGQPVYHMDAYRLKNTDEAVHAGIEEYIHSGNWCFIEWPEKIKELIHNENFISIHLSVNASNNRNLIIEI